MVHLFIAKLVTNINFQAGPLMDVDKMPPWPRFYSFWYKCSLTGNDETYKGQFELILLQHFPCLTATAEEDMKLKTDNIPKRP